MAEELVKNLLLTPFSTLFPVLLLMGAVNGASRGYWGAISLSSVWRRHNAKSPWQDDLDHGL
jgi:hypothetical protein